MTEKKTIVRSDSLSTDRIAGSFVDDLISCPICLNVLWKPIACKNCENSFCTKCIRLWLKDNPKKCPFQCYFQERKPPSILLKILSKLQIICCHQINGCSAILSYEALEKHEQQECPYRLVQCSACSKECLQKDLEVHSNDECPSKNITCFKCSTIYQQRDGHTDNQCLHAQIKVLEEKLHDREDKPKKVVENYNKMVDVFNRSTDIVSRHLSDEEEPLLSNRTSVLNQNVERTLRLSTIDFSRVSSSQPNIGSISNGYGGFNWENAYYINKSYTTTNPRMKGFLRAFHREQENVVYNIRGAALILYLPNPEQTFGLHSFEAVSIYHDTLKVFITAYRSNGLIATKNLILTNEELKLFEIDWEQVDRIVFKPEIRVDHLRQSTFAISTLNLIL